MHCTHMQSPTEERAHDLLARQRASRRFDRGLIVLLTVTLLYFVADKLPCKVVAGAATCCPGHELSMSYIRPSAAAHGGAA